MTAGSVAHAAWWLALAFLAAQWLVVVPNLVAFRPLHPRPGARAPDEGGRPVVSLLVPVRDELRSLPHTLPGWLAQGADEVLVLDDHSEDGSAAFLAEAARVEPRLRVLSGRPLPPGWNGKNWACDQLARAARGDALVFTDADVCWAPGALDLVIDDLMSDGVGLVTVWPRQRLGSVVERIAVPQVDLVLLGGLPLPLVDIVPAASLAAGNGQLMAWRRAAYRLSGGHAAVRGEVLEDVRLAQRAKGAGVRLRLRLGGDWVQTRMYHGGGEVVAGFAKNVLAAVGGGRATLLAVVALNLVAHTLPWLLALVDPRWLLPALASVGLRAVVDARVGRGPGDAAWQPLAPLVLARVAARALSRRGYAWKGRRYP